MKIESGKLWMNGNAEYARMPFDLPSSLLLLPPKGQSLLTVILLKCNHFLLQASRNFSYALFLHFTRLRKGRDDVPSTTFENSQIACLLSFRQ